MKPFKRPVSDYLKLVIGIRREDPRRIWERRAPLVPDDVYNLLSKHKGLQVHVAPCHRRVFPTSEYEKAGAKITPDVSSANIVLGIKEVPLDELPYHDPFSPSSPSPTQDAPPLNFLARALANSPTHFMFSHTHKGQSYNTPLLARFVAPAASSNVHKSVYPRLVDYELLTGPDGKRTVGFGWFAGVAGVLEALSSMAHNHLEHGIASPFLYTPRPHTVPSLDYARGRLRNIGETISAHGTPSALGPFVVGVTGSGNVSQGCLSMLSELPIQEVQAKDLDALVRNPEIDLRKIYLVHVKPQDYLIGLDGRAYDRAHYYASPQSYQSVFHDRIAPYLTLFLNGTGWSPSFPRLMTNEQLVGALERARLVGGHRFTNIGDISCDIEGGLEFMTRATTLSQPFFKIRPTQPNGVEYPEVQIMSVDILPASLPLDASKHFSKALLPYVDSLVAYHTGSYLANESGVDAEKSEREFVGYQDAISRATIAKRGVLQEGHEWLGDSVERFYEGQRGAVTVSANAGVVEEGLQEPVSAASGAGEPEQGSGVQVETTSPVQDTSVPKVHPTPGRSKRILMLGSGMVAKPAVDMIARHPGVELVIASDSLLELQALARPHLNVSYRIVDVSNTASYLHLLQQTDVVISLLPVQFHPVVGKLCVEHKKHMVTASYISEDMARLDRSALDADVLLLNEIGLDPGIDHCSAIDLISRLRAQQQDIVSFTSFCGGLPAPEDSHVPLRYKFSWRPQGVLSAAMNPAQFMLKDRIEVIPGKNLLRSYFSDLPITKQFALEGIPNRDSLQYIDTYQLDKKSLRTIMRGTLRYPGFSTQMHAFIRLGLLDASHKVYLERWTDLLPLCLSHRYREQTYNGVLPTLADILPASVVAEVSESLTRLGLLPHKYASPLIASPTDACMPPLPSEPMTPLDIFAYLLAQQLGYKEGERDMVVLSHEFIARDAQNKGGNSGPHLETVHTSSLIVYGNEEGSAMSRTVGIPVAIAALQVVEGNVKVRGVAGPSDASVYKPVLEGLEEVGLGMEERERKVLVGAVGAEMRGEPTVEETLERSVRMKSGFGGEERERRPGPGGVMETEEERRDLEREWVQ